jgi:hypothetical protein
MNQLPVWHMFGNMTRSRADTVSARCNGSHRWRPRAVQRALARIRIRVCIFDESDDDYIIRVGASTQPQGTLDEDTFRQRYGETVHHRTN